MTNAQNMEVLRKFKIGQNLMLSQLNHPEDPPKFGVLEGFSLNCFDEVILNIRIIVSGDEIGPLRQIHPYTKMVSLELL